MRRNRPARGYATLSRSRDATAQAFDGTRIETMPGVRIVLRQGRFLGVVAARQEQAGCATAL